MNYEYLKDDSWVWSIREYRVHKEGLRGGLGLCHVEVHQQHTNNDATTFIDIETLYRDLLNDDSYKANQKTAYATR